MTLKNQDGSAVGYSLIFESTKVTKGKTDWTIKTYDQDLQQIKDVKFSKPYRKFFVLDNAYNGVAIGYYFFNYKEKKYELNSYDSDMKKLGSFVSKEKIPKNQAKFIYSNFAAGMNSTYRLYPIPNKGFVQTTLSGKFSFNFAFEGFDNKMKSKWKFNSEEIPGKIKTFIMNEVGEKYLIAIVNVNEKLLSRSFSSYLLILDVVTGKKISLIKLNEKSGTDALTISYSTYLQSLDEILIIGEFFKPEDASGSGKSLGFYAKRINVDGKTISGKKFNWNNKFKDLISNAGKLSIEKDGYYHSVQDVKMDKDGNIYIVFEQFKRKINAIALAAKIYTRNAGVNAAHGVLGNFVIAKLDNELKLNDVKFFTKEKSDVELFPGSDFLGLGLVGLQMKSFGKFDYMYAVSSSDSSSFEIHYINKEKDDGNRTAQACVITKDAEGKFHKFKTEVTAPKKTFNTLYRGKEGHILLSNYARKEKKLTLSLIKVNKNLNE
jgi:hypothetical protein